MNIVYTGKNGKTIKDAFGGSHGNVKFNVPAEDGNKPRSVTFSGKPLHDAPAPSEIEACAAMLLGTGLYQEAAPVVSAKAKAASVEG